MSLSTGKIAPVGDEPAYNRTIYDDAFLRVGLFRCRPWEDLFHEDDRALGRYLVFPRTSVLITPDGGEPLVADPTVVMFYNKFQTYRRHKLSDQGDACAYFEFAPHVLAYVLPHYDPLCEDGPHYPFPLHRARSDARSYLLHRLVVSHLLRDTRPDKLFVQETMMQVLERIVETVLPRVPLKDAPSHTREVHAALTRQAQVLLATRYHEPLTLEDIAAHLYVSPYHLCRVFRRHSGVTLHQYRNDLRLRHGLERILNGEDDLSALALSLGYANHSHFTKAFRTQFQTTPSDLRDTAARHAVRSLSRMSKNLTV